MHLKGRGHDVFLPIYFSSLTFSNFIISCDVKSEIPSSQVKGFCSAPLYMNPEQSGSETLYLGRWWDTCLAFICYVNKKPCHVFFLLLTRGIGATPFTWGSIAKTEIKSAYQITIYSQIKLNTSHLLSHPTLGRGSNLTWTYNNLNYILVYQTFQLCKNSPPPPHCCLILVPGDHVLKKGIYPTWGYFHTSFSLFGSMVFEKTFFFFLQMQYIFASSRIYEDMALYF